MKERLLTSDLRSYLEKPITISGWVDSVRDHGKLAFIDLRDRGGVVQVVCLKNHEGVLETAQSLRPESVLTIEGIVHERPEKMRSEGVNGNVEVEATSLTVLSLAEELPFEKDAEINIDTYLDHLPLTLRRPGAQHTFALQARLVEAYRRSLREQGFTEFQAPALVGGDAEGGANVFKVEYFNDKPAYLATSPQFYKQILVGVFERVFTTARVFRAEKHSTTRHLNEYISLDFEMGFIEDHQDVMRVLEGVVREMVKASGVNSVRLAATFPSMKLREAQEVIFKETGEDCREEPDLEPSHERFLCEWAAKEYGSDFIFITHYPVGKRPFYTYEDENDPGLTKSFDLLFRGVEIVTGGQRIHSYNTLIEKLQGRNLDHELFSYYLQSFKYGMPPHGGCAIGLERITQKLMGLENVKEATLFPRDMNRIDTLLSS
jgi:nondiscriminating aspartyl-tRNA synthetase